MSTPTYELLDEIFNSTVRLDKVYALANTVHHDSLDSNWKELLEDPSDEVKAILINVLGIDADYIETQLDAGNGAENLAEVIMRKAWDKDLNGFIVCYQAPHAQSADGTHYGFGQCMRHWIYTEVMDNNMFTRILKESHEHFEARKAKLALESKSPKKK